MATRRERKDGRQDVRTKTRRSSRGVRELIRRPTRERERVGPVAERRPKTSLTAVAEEPPSGRLRTLHGPMRTMVPGRRSREVNRAGAREPGTPTARNCTCRVPAHSIRNLLPRPCPRRGVDPGPPRSGGTPIRERTRCGNGPSGAPIGVPSSGPRFAWRSTRLDQPSIKSADAQLSVRNFCRTCPWDQRVQIASAFRRWFCLTMGIYPRQLQGGRPFIQSLNEGFGAIMRTR